jgi:hypothetical protein
MIASKNNDWKPFLIVAGIMAGLCLMLQILWFKVGPDGFVCRTLISSKAYDYANVAKGFFTVSIRSSTPQGTANFCIELKDGTRTEINLRLYTIGAAVSLFDEFERHGIPIEVPDLWAVHRMIKEILKAKSKRDLREAKAA